MIHSAHKGLDLREILGIIPSKSVFFVGQKCQSHVISEKSGRRIPKKSHKNPRSKKIVENSGIRDMGFEIPAKSHHKATSGTVEKIGDFPLVRAWV